MDTPLVGLRAPVALAAVILSQALGVPNLHAQSGRSLEEAIVEVRIANGPQRVFPAVVGDSLVLLPLEQVLELVEIRVLESAAGSRVMGVLEPGGIRIGVDTERQVLLRPGGEAALDVGAVAWLGASLHVATHVLAEVLGVAVDVDWVDLTVAVRHTGDLPVVRRMELERRRASLLAATALPGPANHLQLDGRAVDGAVLDWAVTSGTRDPLNTSAVHLGFGAQLAGGSLALRHTERRTTLGAAGTTTASWTKAWADGRWVRQAGVGDIPATGRRFARIRGATVTNTPFVRPSYFGNEELGGTLGPEWGVELYHGERLVAFAETDPAGRYRFDVPVRYGPNPLNLIAYGPHGEIFPLREMFAIPFGRLPGGKFEYGAGVGQCSSDPCRATANLDARYGLSERLTLQAGTDLFWQDATNPIWYPYATASGSVGRGLNLTGEAVLGALVGGGFDYAPTQDFQLGIQHRAYFANDGVPIMGSAVLRHRTLGSLFWRPAQTDQGVYFRVSGMRVQSVNAIRDLIRVSATARVASTRIEVALRREGRDLVQFPRTVRFGVDVSGAASLSGPGLLRALFVRGSVSVHHDSGLARVRLELGRQVLTSTRIDLAAAWQRDGQGPGIQLAVTTAMPAFRAMSRNRYTAATGMQGIQFAEGSVMWDGRSQRVTFGDGRILGRAGIAGRVFLDSNANGLKDSGERDVPGVKLRIGSFMARTDSAGRFAIWDVVPFEALEVAVDSNSISHPLWIPSSERFRVHPPPNGISWVEVPLIVGGEVSGRVVFAETDFGAGGIRLGVRNVDTGGLIRGRTFSDGGFYLLGVPPGNYEVTVAPDQLERLGLAADPVQLTVSAGDGGNILEGVEVVLRRR
jgi:hypothetical protein